MDVAMSKGREEVDHGFVFLTDDILLNILKRVPEDFLRYKAKHVCRQWFNIITNIILRDHASFILDMSCLFRKIRRVDITEEGQGLEVKEKILDIDCNGRIKSWYNEFLLISNSTGLSVLNLITKEISYLPQSPTSHHTSRCRVALFFDEFKGVYKVVLFHMDPTIQFHILVLGRYIASDLSSLIWKKMEVPFDIENQQSNYCIPFSVQVQGRYFHCNLDRSDYLVSVDMAKEKIFQIRLPGSNDRTSRSSYSIFEMGGFLTLIDGGGVGADIWILKDLQRMKWEKLQSITVLDHDVTIYPGHYFARPVCGVISKRYIIFMTPTTRSFSYDLKNGVMKELNFYIQSGDPFAVQSSATSFM